MTTKREAATKMVDSLRYEAKRKGVDLSGLTIDNLNVYLDDAFQDGGEVRCEKFIDLALKYSIKFRPLGPSREEQARWECIELAFEMLKKE